MAAPRRTTRSPGYAFGPRCLLDGPEAAATRQGGCRQRAARPPPLSAALDSGLPEQASARFAPDGAVVSPRTDAARGGLYSALFANSAPSRTAPRRAYVDPDEPREVALAFHYDWTLGDCMAHLRRRPSRDPQRDHERIERLTIRHDMAPLRAWRCCTMMAP